MAPERPVARLLVALLLLTQATLPAAAALAEEPPTAAHQPHVSEKPGTGCEPLHDELACLLCRVLSAHPLVPATQLPPRADAPELRLRPSRATSVPAARGAPFLWLARAPPVS